MDKKYRICLKQKKQQRSGPEDFFRRVLPVLLLCAFTGHFLEGCGEPESIIVSGEMQEEGSEGTGDIDSTVIYVHVCGAVNSPGLKCLDLGSRAWDALECAGGFAEGADRDAVNLAAQVEDGQQLYFPTLEEQAARQQELSESRIDLNAADEAQLCMLPGIGSTRAKAILEYRKDKGRFREISELMNVPGIKEVLYEQICDLVYIRN